MAGIDIYARGRIDGGVNVKRKDCGHVVWAWPPLATRKGNVKLEDLPCGQCVTESNERFYAELRTRAEAERCEPGFNPLTAGNPHMKGVRYDIIIS